MTLEIGETLAETLFWLFIIAGAAYVIGEAEKRGK